MPAWLVPTIISGLGALSGALSGRKKKQETTTQATSTGTTSTTGRYTRGGTTSIDTSTLPVLSPQQQIFQNMLFNRYGNLLNKDVDLSGYSAEGIRNINRVGDIRSRLLQNTLASRGLSYSPIAATATATGENQRLGDIISLLNNIPLLREQIERERLGTANQFIASTPTGQRQTGTTTTDEFDTQDQTGTSTQQTSGVTTQITPSDILSGLVGGLGQGIASTYGYNWALDQLRRTTPQIRQGNVNALMQPPRGFPTPPNLNNQVISREQINNLLNLLNMLGGG